MARKVRDVQAALTSKGFREVTGGDHWRCFFYHNGKKSSINTKISHGERDISDMLCSAMAKQVRLTNPQFGQLVDCSLTGDAYLQLLLTAGHVKV